VYVNDPQDFSVEMLHVQPWYDGRMGFTRECASPNIAVAGLRNLTVEMPFSCSSDSLWKALSEHEHMASWWPFKKVELVKEGKNDRNGEGAVRHMKGLGPTLEEEVVTWSPGCGYDYRVVRGAPVKDYFASVRVLPQGEGNLVQWRIQFRPAVPGTGAVTQWLLRKLIVRVLGTLNKQLGAVP
jgi:hypothetical protein